MFFIHVISSFMCSFIVFLSLLPFYFSCFFVNCFLLFFDHYVYGALFSIISMVHSILKYVSSPVLPCFLFSSLQISNENYERVCILDPCKKKKCNHNATCVINKDFKAYCQCPECRVDTKNPVCGSDGKTYPNECEVRRTSCMNASPVTVVKQGKCGKAVV